jgi:hypothetical protein
MQPSSTMRITVDVENVPVVVLLARTHVSPYALQKNDYLILGQLYM